MEYKKFLEKINIILEKEVDNIDEITSLELVVLMSELNDLFKKDIEIFEMIELESLKSIYDLYSKQ